MAITAHYFAVYFPLVVVGIAQLLICGITTEGTHRKG